MNVTRTSRVARMLDLTGTASEVLLIGLAVWLTVGVTLAVLMGRRGHSPFEWFLIGAILGPLALPAAWARTKDESVASGRHVLVAAPAAGRGPVDILVGIDGSEESQAALRTALDLLGSRIGRLTLASVTDFDYGSAQAKSDSRQALDTLRKTATVANVPDLGMTLLSGRPADALSEHARQEGYHLVVVGRRGRGASKAVLGSTSSQLTRSPVPVLVT
jgi:nucleotide-binding universal stress UspA family protein